MGKFKATLNDQERLARKVTGIESEAIYHSVNEQAAEDDRIRQNAARFNQEVGDLQERFQKHVDAIQDVAKDISMASMEIMPLTSYALITPFNVNPFQQIKKTDSGLIIDLGGMTPSYKSEESGQIEEETPYVKVGIVHEVGAECKFLQQGDIVFYNVASEIIVPFYKFGFVVVAEQRIIAVVNEGLTKRKELIKESK